MTPPPDLTLHWVPDRHLEVAYLIERIDAPQDRRGVQTYDWLLEQLRALHPTRALLARLRAEPVALALLTGDGTVDVVHTLFTLPDHRTLGIGSALLAEVRINAPGVLRGLALPGDRATKNLFERAGMPAQLLVL